MDFLELLKEKYGTKNSDRIKHSIGVKDMAVLLGSKMNLDTRKLEIAALFHDYYRYDSDDILISLMDKKDYEIYKDMPWGYHGLAAGNMIKEFGITDMEIINSIKYHTVGRKNMSIYEKIIYVSDFCEVNRTHEGSKEVRELALKDFDKAFLLCMDYTYKHTNDKNVKELLDYYGEIKMKDLDLIVSELDKLNLEDIKVYNLKEKSPLFDYVIISTSKNDRQANAIIRNLRELEMKGEIKIKGIEDKDLSWILVDLDDIIVHVFTGEARLFYGLDEIYKVYTKD